MGLCDLCFVPSVYRHKKGPEKKSNSLGFFKQSQSPWKLVSAAEANTHARKQICAHSRSQTHTHTHTFLDTSTSQ